MSDNEPTQPQRLSMCAPAQYTLSPALWRCPVHGETSLVVSLVCPGLEHRTYCARCLVTFLERLGLAPVPRVD